MNTYKRIYPKTLQLNEYPQFSDRLKVAMDIRGCTVAELAANIYISPATISMYRRGKRMPSTEVLCLIARALDVSTDFLLGLQNYIYV